MKKLLAATLMVALVLAGCSAAGAGKLGLASKTTMDMSADLADNNGVKEGTAQADTMMCAVVVDANGKVVSIKIDTVQSPIKFDESGKIKQDKATTTFKTKRELGNDYGMKKASKIGKEWFEQVDAIQSWMVGKTADQIKAMKVKKGDEGNISDEPDLSTGATIGIDEFLEVAVAAINNAK